MKIDLLSNYEEKLPIIAKWYIEEWGHLDSIKTTDQEIEKLRSFLNLNKVPLMLLAIEKDELLAVAQIKEYEMSIYPEYKYWLGGVYVSKYHRNKGIAKSIVTASIQKAKELNISKLYLQTESLSGGLYRDLGWVEIEEVNYHDVDVLVMAKELN